MSGRDRILLPAGDIYAHLWRTPADAHLTCHICGRHPEIRKNGKPEIYSLHRTGWDPTDPIYTCPTCKEKEARRLRAKERYSVDKEYQREYRRKKKLQQEEKRDPFEKCIYRCQACGTRFNIAFNVCPHCGGVIQPKL